tara:strand:- start:202 stop:525 length:324 start_codon:yes stop_codon:yes gene_type:complete
MKLNEAVNRKMQDKIHTVKTWEDKSNMVFLTFYNEEDFLDAYNMFSNSMVLDCSSNNKLEICVFFDDVFKLMYDIDSYGKSTKTATRRNLTEEDINELHKQIMGGKK